MCLQSAPTRPETRTFDDLVQVPTLRITLNTPNGAPQLVVQWFGQTRTHTFDEYQFQFPVHASLNDAAWMGRPTGFQVLFLGQVRDWPKKEAVENMSKSYGAETWIIWLIAAFHLPGSLQCESSAPMIATFIRIMWADGVYGIITPRPYTDGERLARLAREAQLLQTRAIIS